MPFDANHHVFSGDSISSISVAIFAGAFILNLCSDKPKHQFPKAHRSILGSSRSHKRGSTRTLSTLPHGADEAYGTQGPITARQFQPNHGHADLITNVDRMPYLLECCSRRRASEVALSSLVLRGSDEGIQGNAFKLDGYGK